MYVYKYSVDKYLLCMIKVRLGGVLVVCGLCYNLEEIDRSVFVVLFENLKIHGMSS